MTRRLVEGDARVALVTLGCAKNDADSARLATLLARRFTLVEDLDSADAVVANTCGFIEDAVQQSLAAVIEIAGLPARPVVAAVGCLASRYGKELEQALPEAGLVAGGCGELVLVGQDIGSYGRDLPGGQGEGEGGRGGSRGGGASCGSSARSRRKSAERRGCACCTCSLRRSTMRCLRPWPSSLAVSYRILGHPHPAYGRADPRSYESGWALRGSGP